MGKQQQLSLLERKNKKQIRQTLGSFQKPNNKQQIVSKKPKINEKVDQQSIQMKKKLSQKKLNVKLNTKNPKKQNNQKQIVESEQEEEDSSLEENSVESQEESDDSNQSQDKSDSLISQDEEEDDDDDDESDEEIDNEDEKESEDDQNEEINNSQEEELDLYEEEEEEEEIDHNDRYFQLSDSNEKEQYGLIFGMGGEKIIFEGEFNIIPIVGNLRINGYDIDSTKEALIGKKCISVKGASYLCVDFTHNKYTIVAKKHQKQQPYQELLQNLSKLQNETNLIKIIDSIDQQAEAVQENLQIFENVAFVYKIDQDICIKDIVMTGQENQTGESFITYGSAQIQQLKQMNQSLKIDNSNKVILVAGGKNSGKSSYCLHLVNHFASNSDDKVFLLDTDLGQGLFNFPGTVNLYCFGANDIIINNLGKITYSLPLSQYVIGEFSPQNFIQQYIASIQECIRTYRDLFKSSVLVINTCGYINNIGEILLYDTIKITQPEFIYLMGEKVEHIKNQLIPNKQAGNANRISFYSNSQEQLLTEKQISVHKNRIFEIKGNWELNENKINNSKRHKKDQVMLSYLLQQNNNNQQQNQQQQQQQDRPYFFIQSQIEKLYQMETLETKIENLDFYLNYRKISDKREIVLSFLSSLIAFSEVGVQVGENNQLRPIKCVGFGFIKDFDLENNTVLIVTPLKPEHCEEIKTVIKFTEIEFSKNFNSGNIDNIIMGNEVLLDMEADFSQCSNNIVTPFLVPNVAGIGTQAFRNRVSQRKSK